MQMHAALLGHFLPLLVGSGCALHMEGAQHLMGHCRGPILGLPGRTFKKFLPLIRRHY